MEPDTFDTVPLAYSLIAHASDASITVSKPVAGTMPYVKRGVKPRLSFIVLKIGARLTLPSSKRTLKPAEKPVRGML
jgi:hypothetical protein